MHTDLTFITNQDGQTLRERFLSLIKDTKFFDVLVGYFYLSGFHLLIDSLQKTEKIRILIGIGIDERIYKLMNEEDNNSLFSYYETKNAALELIKNEMDNSEDNKKIEDGIRKFIEWIDINKLEIRAYPTKRIHAKLYIMTFKEDDRDIGRVITGSSNFTYSGLVDNLEFNVELKNYSDYIYAKNKFEELWQNSVDVSKDFVLVLKEKTWLKEDITPYEIYLKTLKKGFRIKEVPIEHQKRNFGKSGAIKFKVMFSTGKDLIKYIFGGL